MPILATIQCHPEAPRLWEKYADQILRIMKFTATAHEPCLYAGLIHEERVLIKRQVDDFEVAVPTERSGNILFDTIEELLKSPLNRMGRVTLFNGVDVLQTRDYITILVEVYITRVCGKHMSTIINLSKVFTTSLNTRSK